MGADDIFAGLVIGGIMLGLIFILTIIGTAVGAFTGWVISITPLGKWVVEGLQILGFDAGGKLVQLGAMLGFITGFLRGVIKVNKEE